MQDRTCTIDGCDKRAAGHGWCQTHYMRWRRHLEEVTYGENLRRAAEANAA